jgi:putative addiction module killer protein
MDKILRYYIKPNGKSPFSEWVKKIKDRTTQSRIERRLERMENGNYGDYKNLGDGVFELRLDFGAGYRIYFAEIDSVIVLLLCGGDKSTQPKDIALAKQYLYELRGRKQ